MSHWIEFLIVVGLCFFFWYLGLGMGYECGEKKQIEVADEYRRKYRHELDRYDALLERYMKLRDTFAKVVDKNG